MASLIVQSGPAPGRTFGLAAGLNRLGRAAGNEVCLDDPSVSSVHCELWLMQERLLVRDLGSTNGTFLNGRPVSEAEVGEGDTLALGAIELIARDVPQRVEIPKPPPPPPPPPRYTPDGDPCCVNHWLVQASFRCRKCGEQFCEDCVRLLGRRGGMRHAYCPLCDAECVPVMKRRTTDEGTGAGTGGGWLAKLTQTLRLRR